MEIWLWYVRIVGNWELFHKWNLGLFYVYIGPPGEEGLKILILRLSAQLWQIIPLCLRWGYAHIDKFFSNQLIHSSLGSLLREFINHDKSKRIQLDIVDSYGDTSEPVVTVFTSNSPVILLLKKNNNNTVCMYSLCVHLPSVNGFKGEMFCLNRFSGECFWQQTAGSALALGAFFTTKNECWKLWSGPRFSLISRHLLKYT